MSNCMMNFFREILNFASTFICIKIYIDSFCGKGSRDKNNNDYSLELKFNMINAS